MTTVKNPYPLCDRDEFPMVKIGSKHQCVAEYLNKHIGQKAIVDVIRHGEITYYVFENRYELPLLCFCCGTPLVIKDLGKFRQNMYGRRLESMAVDRAPAPDGGEFLEFQLEFSKKGFELGCLIQAIAPEAAAKMRHPNRHNTKRKSGELAFSKKGHRSKHKKGFG